MLMLEHERALHRVSDTLRTIERRTEQLNEQLSSELQVLRKEWAELQKQ